MLTVVSSRAAVPAIRLFYHLHHHQQQQHQQNTVVKLTLTSKRMTTNRKTFSLPVLDLDLWIRDRASFAHQFREACTDIGFLYLKCQLQTHNEMMNEARRFFSSSTDIKRTVDYANSPSLRGYMALGVENTAGKIDMREQIEYAVEYPIDFYPPLDKKSMEEAARLRPLYERLRARQNPWPNTTQPTLQPTTLAYASELESVANILRQAFCLALGLTVHGMDHLFLSDVDKHPPHWVLKLLSYPSITRVQGVEQPEWGVGEHVDTNFLTIISQDAPGLQAWVDGTWIDVPPVPPESNSELDGDRTHYLVVNLGEQAQVLSRSIFCATPHRVSPHSGQSNRTSLAFFYNPPLRTTLTPLPIDVSLHKINRKWQDQRPNTILETVGDNTFKSLARSHPHVFCQHHPDVIVCPDGRLERSDET